MMNRVLSLVPEFPPALQEVLQELKYLVTETRKTASLPLQDSELEEYAVASH